MSTQHPTELNGIVHGKVIELDHAPGLPDGQHVTVTIRAASISGGGLQRAVGSWTGNDEQLDRWLEETYQARKQWRAEPLK